MQNISWHPSSVSRLDREKRNNHKSCVLWFTGLSGSGKSTLAHAVEEKLHRLGCKTYVLDGDNIRHGLCKDLSFSESDRKENVRRVGEVAKLFVEAGVIVLTAFISPYRDDRKMIRNLLGDADFFEIYCECEIDTCESRDVKGLYKKAREGKIKNFTGISAPYEIPEKSDLVINTDELTVDASVEKILTLVRNRVFT